MSNLADTIMRIFATALGIEESFFATRIDRHPSVLRLTYYPAQDAAPLPGQVRSGEHTDYGSLTILRGDDVPGGLQVRKPDGTWLDAHPAPGSFICNIGDLMMRWTNDRWLSNLHQVANPPREYAHIPRLTIVYFQNPNFDAEIKVIDPTKPPKYEPVRWGEYYLGKHMKAQHLTTDEKAARTAAGT